MYFAWKAEHAVNLQNNCSTEMCDLNLENMLSIEENKKKKQEQQHEV